MITSKKYSKPLKYLTKCDLRKMHRTLLYSYIKRLHQHISKQHKFLISLRRKLIESKENKKTTEVDTKPIIGPQPEEITENASDFIASIKQTAEEVAATTGFVYEPTSGLYYDYKTGYYYNSELGLYYDGTLGCYYNYDQEKQVFSFHSYAIREEEPENDKKQIKSKTNDDDPTTKAKEVLVDGTVLTATSIPGKRRHRERERDHKSDRRRRRYSSSSSTSVSRSRSSCSSSYSISDDHDSRHRYRRRRPRSSHRRRRSSHKKSSKKRTERSAKKSSRKSKLRRMSKSEEEDGEILSSDQQHGSDGSSVILIEDKCEADEIETITAEGERYPDIAKQYPPSLRLIVIETNLANLKIGSLFVVTYKGGSLGREGDHEVVIPDINVSKFHLKFTYDTKRQLYQITDMGSRNGTFVNGERVSNALQESDPLNLHHGSYMQLSQTKLLCHIHDGYMTCASCEPGLVAATVVAAEEKLINPVTMENKEILYKRELKRIQKKYGLENEKYIEQKIPKNFNDRAGKRRKEKGSSNSNEKTQSASLEMSIPAENKGFKMLTKLGWSEGQTLGKNDTGLLEPIELKSNQGKKGLGSNQPVAIIDKTTEQKQLLWRKTNERFNKIQPANEAFQVDESDEDKT